MEVISKMLKASIFISSTDNEEKSTGSHIAREILLLLVNNLYEKRISETQNGRNFGSARAIRNLHSCYNVALVLHEKCNRFQPIRHA